jgi:hypothetical protein
VPHDGERRFPLNSSLISKVEKARRYAEEPERVRFNSFTVAFHGGHDEHVVTMQEATFTCTCHFYEAHDTCAHIMAMQRILHDMLSEEQQTVGTPVSLASA